MAERVVGVSDKVPTVPHLDQILYKGVTALYLENPQPPIEALALD